MHQHNPFDNDFGAFEPEPHSSGRAKRIILGTAFIAALVAAAGVGFGLGRGAWTMPGSVAASIPAPLTRWLPGSLAGPGPASPPSELKDYAFELVQTQVKQGEAVLTVRLVHKPTGKPVPDAVIFAQRLDMAPEGMPTMTTKLEAQPATEPGLYRFRTDLTMEGGWQLSLGAKVQGEAGTVQTKLALKAVP